MAFDFITNFPHEMLIKVEESTNPEYGCLPTERPFRQYLNYGLIILDKPVDPTSHEVGAWVKSFLFPFGITKVGHGGTLDPKVSGILPLALNDATQIQDVLLSSSKEYVGLMHLHGVVEESQLNEVFQKFQGIIYQRPPNRSAVKREIRPREIYSLKILEFNEKDVLFHVECAAGTYIRTLCHEIGQTLGCGAHMTELRRIRSGVFSESTGCVILQAIADMAIDHDKEPNPIALQALIQPMETAFLQYCPILVKDASVNPICRGANVNANDIVALDKTIKKNDSVAIFTQKGEIIGRGRSLGNAPEIMDAGGSYVVKIQHIYMEPGLYRIRA